MIRSGSYRWLTLGTSLVGVLAFAVADHKPMLALAALGAAGFSSVLVRQDPPRTLPRWILNGLVLMATLYALLSVAARDNVISDLTDYLTLVLLVKTFDRARMRDEAQMLGLSIFVVIGAVLTGAQLALGLTLVFYTPLVIACVVLWQVHSGAELARNAATAAGVPHTAWTTGPGDRRAHRQLLGTTAVAVALSLLAGVFGFVVTPRNLVPGMGGWGRPTEGAVTRFTEQIKLGSAGLISESPLPVMDVVVHDGDGRLIGADGQPIYLRGAVLDEYDRRQSVWRRHENMMESKVSRTVRGDPGDLRTLDISDSPASALSTRQRLTLDVTLRNVTQTGSTPLFSVFRPIAVTLTPTVSHVDYDPSDGTLRRYSGDPGRLAYHVVAQPDFVERDPPPMPAPPQAQTRIRGYTESVLTAAGIKAGVGMKDPLEVRRAARAIVEALRQRCSYTLEMIAPGRDQDPVEMFLFDTRQGHCEYFAAAMVTMCRSVGIDARIVTGYVGGEFNTIAGHYTIRDSDAHAWVELRTSAGRWETFDPTPASGLMHTRRSGGGVLAMLRQFYEALEFSWAENVVSFDQSKRGDLIRWDPSGGPEFLTKIGARFGQLRRWLGELLPRGGWADMATVAAVLVVALGISLVLFKGVSFCWRMARAWFSKGTAAPRDAVPANIAERTRFYRRTLDLLSRHGLAKPGTCPPLAHARTLRAVDPAAADLVHELGNCYYRLRFGGEDPSGQTDTRAAECLRLLSQHLAATHNSTLPRGAAPQAQ